MKGYWSSNLAFVTKSNTRDLAFCSSKDQSLLAKKGLSGQQYKTWFSSACFIWITWLQVGSSCIFMCLRASFAQSNTSSRCKSGLAFAIRHATLMKSSFFLYSACVGFLPIFENIGGFKLVLFYGCIIKLSPTQPNPSARFEREKWYVTATHTKYIMSLTI